MNESNTSYVSVRRVDAVRQRQQEQVLAWARDSKTKALRYILELGPHQNGAACECTCISCGHPLQAVNAGKTIFKNRPHFRHEAGAEVERCHTLSARAALLASLKEGDWIELPRMRRAVTVVGLSGAPYQGWIELEPQRVRIDQLRFADTTTAEVVLTDGRRLQVVVTGSAEATALEDGPCIVPRIEIATDDPQLAALDAAKLREMLVPMIKAARWCGHWPALELEAAAHDEARRAASEALDWDWEDQEGHAQLPPDLRRESLLHREVKTILAAAQSVLLPGWRVPGAGDGNSGKQIVTVADKRTLAHLAGARLEKKLGRIIPDVIAQLENGSELLVEVTVTNTITPERLERIRAVDLPTIEIDFSRMAGVLHRDRLRTLVLDEVTGKNWLHHPAAKRPQMILSLDDDSLVYGVRMPEHQAVYRHRMRDTSAEEWGASYVQAVMELAWLDYVAEKEAMWDWDEARQEAYDDLMRSADGLRLHGFPEALDHRLFDNGHTMLHRLISIARGSVVGYKYKTVWQVINTMLTEVSNASRSWHGLYLIAIQAYRPNLSRAQEERVAEWRDQVRASIQAGETLYLRDPRYDALFGLLFPKMLPALDKPAAKRTRATDVPALLRHDDREVDEDLFTQVSSARWHWTTSYEERLRQLEIAASQARSEGWSVGPTSILHQLAHARFGPYPWIVVEHVAVQTGVEDVWAWRYLYREGYIALKSR